MSNAIALVKTHVPALSMSEDELLSVLKNSLYPGAAESSIKLVLSYCKASGLDPMQKPVHIVPMHVSTGKKNGDGYDIKEWRDTIMPGIGLYRTQAVRSGEYAGVSEPEYGNPVTEKLDGVEITYPEWCRVTVKRLLPNGAQAEFSSREFWKENYATKSAKTKSPNQVWAKRPYAQLAKCAEAQALRKAFPEIGAQPTADEMEGKELDDNETTIDGATGEVLNRKEPPPKTLPPYPDDRFASSVNTWQQAIASGNTTPDILIAKISTRYTLSDEQKAKICKISEPAPLSPESQAFVAEMEGA
jgi:phage recombination protein Bet